MRFITILVLLGVLAGCGQTAQQDSKSRKRQSLYTAVPFVTRQALNWEAGCIPGDKPCVERSISTYKTVLATSERTLGLNHPALSQYLSGLGLLYIEQGEYTQAEPLLKRALAIREKALGPDHPYVAQCLHSLGVLYHARGQDTLAEPLHKRALAIREKALGPDHPDVPQSLNSLAALYRATERDTEAAMLEQRTARIEAIQR